MSRLLILALLLAFAPAPRLRLEASTARSEFLRGDRFTIAAHLFNDGDAGVAMSLAIQAPPGFVLLSAPAGGDIPQVAPGRALGASWGYQVAPDAPIGLARFAVVAYDNAGMPVPSLVREMVVRVGPVVAPPAQGAVWRVYLAVVR